MKIDELLSEFKTINEESYEGIVKAIENTTFEELDLIEEDKLYVDEIKTTYGNYKIYSIGSSTAYIMSEKDYVQYLKDLCYMFAQCLPDKLDVLFDVKGLIEVVLNDNTYIQDVIDFLNKFGNDFDTYKKIGSNEEYVALERIY